MKSIYIFDEVREMESITLNISSWIPWSWHEKRIYLHEFLGLDMKSIYIFDEVREMESITLNISSWIPWSWHEKHIYLWWGKRDGVNYSKYIFMNSLVLTWKAYISSWISWSWHEKRIYLWRGKKWGQLL